MKSITMERLKANIGHSDGILEHLSWKRCTSLQKLIIVTVFVCAISLVSSLWTLVFFILCVVGALKLSNNISHHEAGPLIAKKIVAKLEECYLWWSEILQPPNLVSKTPQPQLVVNDENREGSLGSVLFQDNDKLFDISSNPSQVISEPVRSEINSLQLLIIRDFVQSWYSFFSYNSQFLRETKYILQASSNNLAVSLSSQNLHSITTQLLIIVRAHFSKYLKAKQLFDSHKAHPRTKVPKDGLNKYTSVEDAFEKEFGYHEALSSKETEINYLRGIVSIILLSVCPKPNTDGICTRILLVEILTNSATIPLMDMMANPDWLMELIISLTSEDVKTSEDVNPSTSEIDTKIDSGNIENEIEVVKSPEDTYLPVLHNNEFICSSVEDCESKSNILYKVSEPNLQQTLTESISVQNSPVNERDIQDIESPPANFHDKLQDQTAVRSNVITNSDSLTECQMDAMKPNGENDVVVQSVGIDFNCTKLSPDCESQSLNLNHKSSRADRQSKDSEFFESVKIMEDDLFSEDQSNSEKVVFELQLESSTETTKSIDPSEQSDDLFEYIPAEMSNPQTLISYCQSNSVPAETSNTPTVPSEQTSSSFPKFTSIKNFFVDSFKSHTKSSSIPKPKTLNIVSSNLPAALNPLTKSKSMNIKKVTSPLNNCENSMCSTPLVLIDGKPTGLDASEKSSTISISSEHKTSESESVIQVDSVHNSKVTTTISPGFFASIQPFFSKSSSQSDLSISTLDIMEESPLVTPSPTDTLNFDLDVNEDQNPVTSVNINSCLMSQSIVAGDQRIIQDISIPLAITNQEYRSSSQYSLYVIEVSLKLISLVIII